MNVTKQKEYMIWSQMKGRCSNENNKKYPNYGGRGIKVCDRWTAPGTGYHAFIEDMGYKPTDRHSIERIDVDGDYEPSNCKWIPIGEQQMNKTTSADVKPGDVFGNLTVLYEAEGLLRENKGARIRRVFRVKCQCGHEKNIRMDKLRLNGRNGVNQTCGNRSCNKYAPKDKEEQ
jgi:hypothetical protein